MIFVLLCYSWIFFDFTILHYRAHNPQIDQVSADVQTADNAIPFLGITIELNGLNRTQRRNALERLRENGFGWVRHRMDWGELEPEPEEYQWHSSDEIIADILAAHLVPIVVLDGSPRWARSLRDRTNPLAPPDDFAHFARFAGRFAQRYAEQVRYYQIWDEPNVAPHWGERLIEPIDYARLLAGSGRAIRKVDPGAVIIAAALAPTIDRGHTAIDEVLFLQRLYAATSNQKFRLWRADPSVEHPLFDIIAIQPFGFGTAPNNPRQSRNTLNFYRARLMRRTMLAAGDLETSLWAVRYGWNRSLNSPWRTVLPEKQSVYAIEALDLAYRCWPWLTTVGWVIDQPSAPQTDPFWGFALTPTLGQKFQQWTAEKPERAHEECSQPSALSPQLSALSSQPSALSSQLSAFSSQLSGPEGSSFAFVLALISFLLLWRGWRALTILRLSIWLSRYRSAHPIIHFVTWLGLLWIYNGISWPPLLVLCWLAGVFLCFAQPLQGLCLAILVLPFHYHHKEFFLLNGTWSLPPAHAVMLCLLPVLIWIYIHHCSARFTINQESADFKWDLLALSWLIINLLSMANVWHWPSYLDRFIALGLIPILFYLSTRILVSTSTQKQQVIAALSGGGFLVALVGLFSWIEGGGTSADGVHRLVGPHFSPNHTALYLIRTLFLALGLLHYTFCLDTHNPKSRQAIDKAFGLFVSIIVFIALILTASRGAILFGLPAGAMILVWSLGSRWKVSDLVRYLINRSFMNRLAQRYSMSVLAVSVACTLIFMIGAGVIAIFYGERLLNSHTIFHRFAIWKNSFWLWLDYFWTGVGPGGFFWRYPAYVLTQPDLDPNLRHPHNLWLEFTTFWGTIGLLWLGITLILLWQSTRQFIRRRGSMQIGIQAGMLASFGAALAHAQVDAFATLSDLAGWNWLVIGLIARSSTPNPNSYAPSDRRTPNASPRFYETALRWTLFCRYSPNSRVLINR
ncbi:O-antigen ligase family protein [Chloroflexi bacterium TSY]|nr:O-antigen ligase family protein [Chloroflexi bacterium TSY]